MTRSKDSSSLWVAPLVTTYYIYVLLRQGNIGAALHLAKTNFLREFEQRAWARLFLAQTQPEKALQILERHVPVLETRQQIPQVIEMRILQALAYDQRGDLLQGMHVLQQALFLARGEGYVRLFVDEGKPIAALLAKMLAPQQREQPSLLTPLVSDYARHLLRIFRGQPVDDAHAVPANQPHDISSHLLLQDLSEREKELIRCIASGMSNDEIAHHLVIAKSTVHWHLKNIYSKLAVHNRTQALVKASQLGLLQ